MINFRSFWNTLLMTTLIVGIFDLCLAIGMQWTKTGAFPNTMLYYMAGGVLGLETSMQGGAGIAFIGLLTHFVISFCFTAAVFFVFPALEFHRLPLKSIILLGIVYTPVVNLFMHFVALQLTQLPPPKEFRINPVGFLLFSAVFSIPIFYCAWRHFRLRFG